MEKTTSSLGLAVGKVGAVVVALGALTYFVVTAQRNAQTSEPSGTTAPAAQPGDGGPIGDAGPQGDFFLPSSKSGIVPVAPKSEEEKKKADYFLRSSKSLPLTSEELRSRQKQAPEPDSPPADD